MRTAIIIVAVAVAVAAAGCKRDSSGYCDQTDPTCDDPGEHCDTLNHICTTLDAAPIVCDPQVADSCTSQDPALPFCDPDDHICKQCGDNNQCSGAMPVCDLGTHACTTCADDIQCTSEVCLADGSCADPDDVIYTAPGAAPSGECTQGAACELKYGVDQKLSGSRTIVHLADGAHMPTATIVVTQDAHFIGRGATIDLASASNGAAIRVTGTATVTVSVDYLTITGAQGVAAPLGAGVECLGGAHVDVRGVTFRDNDNAGILASSCVITVQRSTLRDNAYGVYAGGPGSQVTIAESMIRGNRQTGVYITEGTLDLRRSTITLNLGLAGGSGIRGGTGTIATIENNVIVKNGSDGTSVPGGAELAQVDSSSKFRFNTVSGNHSGGSSPGVFCDTLDASSNIIDDVSNCGTMRWSLYGPTAGTMPPGMNNISGMPMFIDTNAVADPVGPMFYRIMMTSSALNMAENLTDVPMDIDGDPRPEGAGRDIGADEAHP